MTDLEIPESGAVFTFGKSRFAENKPSHFFIKNDPVIHIACGDEHTAVICQNGRIFAFGSNEWGQLGLGHNNMVHKPSCIKSLKPERAKYIACGRAHTIILTESNTIYACGSNTDGQLGLDNIDMVNTPTRLPHSVLYENETITKLSAGSQHSAALTESGKVFVWGSNSEGQLGLESSRTNCKLPTLLEFKDKIRDVTCGYYHTAVITENGELFMFGENENGKLGIPQSDSQSHKPTKVNISMPLSIIACGGNHNFGLTEDGVAIAFGSNLQGELGLNKDVTWVTEPTELPANLFNDEKIKMISCGENHTAFITESLKIYTCGDSRHGKLCHDEDDEEKETHTGPKPISRFANYNVTNVSCGGCHTIICAQKNEDELAKTGTNSLPPLQRIPNSILNTDDPGHKISEKSEVVEFADTAEGTINDLGKSFSNEESHGNGLENIISGIKSPIDGITSDFSQIPGKISEAISGQKEELEKQYHNVVGQVQDKSGEILHDVTEKIEEIKSGVSENIDNLKDQAENTVHDTTNEASSWLKSQSEGLMKEANDGITSGMNKFMNMTGADSIKAEPKFESVDNLLQEIEDDMASKSSKESGDTVSIISNEKNSKDMSHEVTVIGNGQETKISLEEDEDVKVPTPPPEKRITKFLNTFRRKKICATAIDTMKNASKPGNEGGMDEITEDADCKTDKTKACTIL